MSWMLFCQEASNLSFRKLVAGFGLSAGISWRGKCDPAAILREVCVVGLQEKPFGSRTFSYVILNSSIRESRRPNDQRHQPEVKSGHDDVSDFIPPAYFIFGTLFWRW